MYQQYSSRSALYALIGLAVGLHLAVKPKPDAAVPGLLNSRVSVLAEERAIV